MTKKLKIMLISIFSAITLFCAGFLICLQTSSRTAFADEEKNFSFTPGAYSTGAYLAENGKFNGWIMGFELNKLTTIYESASDLIISNKKNAVEPYLLYNFSFYRKNKNFNEKLCDYCIQIFKDDGDIVPIKYTATKYIYTSGVMMIMDEQFNRHDDLFTFDFFKDSEGRTATRFPGKAIRRFESNKGKLNLPFYTGKKLLIAINPEDAYTEYFVKMDYMFMEYTSTSKKAKPIIVSGSCQSSTRSLYTIFKNMEDAGMLEEEILGTDSVENVPIGSPLLDAYNYAYNVLHKQVKKKISITYLTPIVGTPFATTTTKAAVVTMREDDDLLTADAASQALNVYTFDCLQSYCDGFEKVGANAYKAHYFNNVWLKARTVDGNDYNYYLNINESYEEFYKHFVDAGIFDQGAYETVFSSRIYADYSDKLQGHSPSTVYGYFGFAIIPKTYGINSLWKDCFNTDTSKSGVVNSIEYGVDLSLSAYNNLLKDYNYSFLRRVWNDAANFFTSGAEDATCYILYAEPGTKTSFIAENGADDINDDSGAAQQPIDDITSAIGNVGGSLVDGISGIGDWFKNLSSKTKTIGIAVLSVCALAVVLVIISNSKKK